MLMEISEILVEIGRNFYHRGWVLGTGGNFSAVTSRDPFRLAITASGVDKGNLVPSQILEIDREGKVIAGEGKPSDETKLHLTVIRTRGEATGAAGASGVSAVLHTHSVWSTIISLQRKDCLEIGGFEMLKGLSGVSTHDHVERVPIIDNSQDMIALARTLEETLKNYPDAHGFLLRGHGLYTWGRSLSEARRHVEIFEFLLEVTGRL
jgi:methylthioribulose-1-phosphate dehydratase